MSFPLFYPNFSTDIPGSLGWVDGLLLDTGLMGLCHSGFCSGPGGDSGGCDLSEEMLVHCVCTYRLVVYGKLRDLLGKDWSNLFILVSGALRTVKPW